MNSIFFDLFLGLHGIAYDIKPRSKSNRGCGGVRIAGGRYEEDVALNDPVEQLDTGSVTLWFEDGSMDHWNADTRTCTDGENTVTVSGTADVTLKFGGDISSLPDGVFADSVTEKIFEDKNKDMLA